ncbi:hypothetical protein [Brevifollis gellanilyticus]|nr:hypothetical protein [Brevifollis gellanilyticus]
MLWQDRGIIVVMQRKTRFCGRLLWKQMPSTNIVLGSFVDGSSFAE